MGAIKRPIIMQSLFALGFLLILISTIVFAPIGLAQTLSGFFSSEKDKEILLNLKQEFDENFEKNENSLRKSYENKKASIRNNTALSEEQRKNQIFQAHKEYQKGSAQNDARYRDPLVSYMIYSANKKYKDPKGRKNKNDKNRIKDSLGTSLFIRDENGAPSKLNPEARGYRGDRDVQGNMKRLNILAATARELGFESFISGDTVDIPGLEVTGNRNKPSYGDPGTDKHRLGIRSAAKNPETYLSPGMSENQPGKNAVAMEDHLGKAKKGRLVSNPNDLLSDGLQDKTQTYAKGTLKALKASGIDDRELKKILDANGLKMSPKNYREALSRLKQDAPTDAAGINKANVKQFKRATDALQDQIAKKASQQFEEEINKRRQEVNNLAKKTSKNNPEVIKGLNEIEDSKVRFEETKANRLDKNPPALKRDQKKANKEAIQPLKPGETLESKKTLRAKARAGASKIYTSGIQGMGKMGDLMTVVSVGNEAVVNLRNGKVGAAIDVVTDAALEEAEAYVGYKTLAAINPLLAQGKMAFDMGYMAGTALGKIDVGDGETIDKKAENFFVKILDEYNGTKKKERANKIRNSLIKELKHGATLGNGMKVVEAAQKIQENIDAGKPPLEGILINPKPAQELIVSEMSSDEKKLLMNDQEFAHLNLKPVNENNKSSENETELSKSIKTLVDTSKDDRQPKTPSEQSIEDKLFKNVMASLAARSKERNTNGFDKNQIKFMNGHLDIGVKALKNQRATISKSSSEKKSVKKEIKQKKNSSNSGGLLDKAAGWLNDNVGKGEGLAEHRKKTQERAELSRKQASKATTNQTQFGNSQSSATPPNALKEMGQKIGEIEKQNSQSKTTKKEKNVRVDPCYRYMYNPAIYQRCKRDPCSKFLLQSKSAFDSCRRSISVRSADPCYRYRNSQPDYQRCKKDPCSAFLKNRPLFDSCRKMMQSAASANTGAIAVPKVKQENMHQGECNERYYSGANAAEQYTIPIAPGALGVYNYSYDHWDVKDRARIYLNGRLIEDTKCTGGKKNIELSVSEGGQFTIIIDPLCDPKAGEKKTKWNFKLSCP